MSQSDCVERDAVRKLQSLARTYLVQSRWKQHAPDAVQETSKQALLALRRSRRKFSLGECKDDKVGQILLSQERRMPNDTPGGDAVAVMMSKRCTSGIAKIQRLQKRFAAGNKQAILRKLTTRLQAANHGHNLRRSFADTFRCVTRLQANVRARCARLRYFWTTSAVLQVQSYWRCHLCQRAFTELKTSIVRSQALHRGNQARKETDKLLLRDAPQASRQRCIDRQEMTSRHTACIRIQSLERGRRRRAQMVQVAQASTRLQALQRGRRIRLYSQIQRGSCVRIQSLQRRARVRKMSALLVVACTRIQAFQRGRGMRRRQQHYRVCSARWLLTYGEAVRTPRDVETSSCTRHPALEHQRVLRRNTNLHLTSVVRLQSVLRGHATRQWISKDVVRATRIQALQRGRHIRRHITDVRVSAIEILAFMRRTRWRRLPNLLECGNQVHIVDVSNVEPCTKTDDSSRGSVNECISMCFTTEMTANSGKRNDGDTDPGARSAPQLKNVDHSANERQSPCSQGNHANKIRNINMTDDTKIVENKVAEKDHENDPRLACPHIDSTTTYSKNTSHYMQMPSSKSREDISIDSTRLFGDIFEKGKQGTDYVSFAMPSCDKIRDLAAESQSHRISKNRAGTTLEGSPEDTREADSRKSDNSVKVAKPPKGTAASHNTSEYEEPSSARETPIPRHVKADGVRVHQTCSRPKGFNEEYGLSHPQLAPVQSNNLETRKSLGAEKFECKKRWPDIDCEVAHGSHRATVERQRDTSTATRTSPETPLPHQQFPLSGHPMSNDGSVTRTHKATASGNATAAALLLRELKRLRQSVESLEQNFELMRVTPQTTLMNIEEADHTGEGLLARSCAKDISVHQNFNGARNFWKSAEACLRRNDLRTAVKVVLRSGNTRTLLKFLARDDLLGEKSPSILARLEPLLLARLFEAITMLVEQRRYTRFVVPWIFSAIRDGVMSRLSVQMRAKIASGLREIAHREMDNVAASLVPHVLCCS